MGDISRDEALEFAGAGHLGLISRVGGGKIPAEAFADLTK